ncbi:transposase, partial [Burkholderia sp. Ac-20384]|uniref:transposase n=1 Tax=Burkholderia sp. Ac-20384 TaxID=2703902 RepID=UPI001F12121D
TASTLNSCVYCLLGTTFSAILFSIQSKSYQTSCCTWNRDRVIQTCIVHLIRNSLEYASYKDRKALAAALRPIYAAASEEAARQA